jgi:hypothetical protein
MDKKQAADISALRESPASAKCRDKPIIGGYKLIDRAASNDQRATVIDVRFYAGASRNASRIYCAIWAIKDQSRGIHGFGIGWAGGYGYDKKSAALGEAIDDAGIKLAQRIDGVGENAMIDAIRAIGAALGYADAILVDFHA